MKMFASKSYAVGPYTVRQDVGASPMWRVFVHTSHGAVSVFSAKTLTEARAFAAQAALSLQTQPTLVPANGGTEQPFTTRTGRRVLYVYDCEQQTHRYLDLGCDRLLPRDWSPLTDGATADINLSNVPENL